MEFGGEPTNKKLRCVAVARQCWEPNLPTWPGSRSRSPLLLFLSCLSGPCLLTLRFISAFFFFPSFFVCILYVGWRPNGRQRPFLLTLIPPDIYFGDRSLGILVSFAHLFFPSLSISCHTSRSQKVYVPHLQPVDTAQAEGGSPATYFTDHQLGKTTFTSCLSVGILSQPLLNDDNTWQ